VGVVGEGILFSQNVEKETRGYLFQ